MERALQVRARERPYQQTYAILRQRVITHAFSPDQPLKCRELADELQVSATAVRDVLLTLSAVGCTSVQKIHVKSDPRGARILIDGQDSGQTTPAEIVLSDGQDT